MLIKPFLTEAGLDVEGRSHEWLLKMVDAIAPNLVTLKDAAGVAAFFFKRDLAMSDSAREVLRDRSSAQVLEAACEWLRRQGRADLHDLVKSVQVQTGLKGKQLYQPLRCPQKSCPRNQSRLQTP